ncbi:hypothetical protein DFH08DRAFT_990747 [Mycena albidolilacea]|uniref:Uncharacterized protein n=1 Tax=Mycena albidolilacea TaxID=1033008 RepID=A0AAD7EVH4_9AGAR|nr:hypothetical protein DFH08DRAFT_990747 [Mycena albidolilacea]
MEENTSEATHGPGWSTETADYLDKLLACHEAEEAEADEKLRLKEERKALRKRKLEERNGNDTTSASYRKGGGFTVRCELWSRTIIPESTLLVKATSEAIDDDHSSEHRRFDAVTPTDASDSHIDSHSPPTTLLVDCHSTSPSEHTASPAPKTVATDASPWPQAGGSARHATHTSDSTKNTARRSLRLGSNRESVWEAPTQSSRAPLPPLPQALPFPLVPPDPQSSHIKYALTVVPQQVLTSVPALLPPGGGSAGPATDTTKGTKNTVLPSWRLRANPELLSISETPNHSA